MSALTSTIYKFSILSKSFQTLRLCLKFIRDECFGKCIAAKKNSRKEGKLIFYNHEGVNLPSKKNTSRDTPFFCMFVENPYLDLVVSYVQSCLLWRFNVKKIMENHVP